MIRRPYKRRGLGDYHTSETMRAYRIVNEDYAEGNRQWNRARGRALTILSNRHRKEYERIFNQQLRKERKA